MLPDTAAWVAKAEGDYGTAKREFVAMPAPNYDATCFHSQQCAEKYLKARLVEANLRFPKLHDLEALLDLAVGVEPSWESLRSCLQDLTSMAVEVRYPGTSADKEDAQAALDAAGAVRGAARSALLLHS